MSDHSHIKEALLQQLKSYLEQKIEMLTDNLKSTQESKNNDTKSSAGDKFETGREMMQAEMDKNEHQRSQLLLSLTALQSIRVDSSEGFATYGSLVTTDRGTYFISIGMGKLEMGEDVYYAVSLASPIGKALSQKKKGDTVDLPNGTLTILDVS